MADGRPFVLRILSLLHRTAHRLSGGRIGAAERGNQGPRGTLLKAITRVHTHAYTLTGGLIGGEAGGLPTLLLTTIGRKSGERRTVPLPYFVDGDRYVLIASNS